MGFGLKMNGHPKAEIAAKVAEASRILKLDDYLKRKPAALSGGQRQRVAIGRAIVRGPEVFLFDEPLSNLDAELRVEMRVEIARLHKEIGATMIYVTHDQVEAMTLADKIVVLRGGPYRAGRRAAGSVPRPRQPFVAGFIGSPAMNFLAATAQGGSVAVPALKAQVAVPVAVPADGTKVTLGLRPEHIEIDPSGDAFQGGTDRGAGRRVLCLSGFGNRGADDCRGAGRRPLGRRGAGGTSVRPRPRDAVRCDVGGADQVGAAPSADVAYFGRSSSILSHGRRSAQWKWAVGFTALGSSRVAV